MFYHNLR